MTNHRSSGETIIFKLGALGDAAMLIPGVAAIKAKYPEQKIIWVCGKAIAELLTCCPAIDELVVVDDKKLFGSLFDRFIEVLKMRKKLSKYKPNYVFIGNPDWKYRASLCGLFLNAKKVTFFPIARKSHIEQYDSALSNLFDIQISLEFSKLNNRFRSSEISTVIGGDIILSPGGARNLLADDPGRRAPVEIFRKLAEHFANHGQKLSIIGGPQDIDLMNHFKHLPNVENLIGKTTPAQLQTKISQASLLISNDSGPLYIALSSGIPSIGLFGPTDPKDRIPIDSKSKGLQSTKASQLACLPCYNGKHYGHCSKPICMNDFSIEKIVSTANQLI